jgi:hypothetical protein
MVFSSLSFLRLWVVFVQAFETREGRPPRIDGSLVLVTGIVEKPHPALGAQAEAIFLTDRLERQ